MSLNRREIERLKAKENLPIGAANGSSRFAFDRIPVHLDCPSNKAKA